jgi:hypothetical protein
MRFWFGLEILRLVYNKAFIKICIERFLAYLTFYPLKKVAPPLINFFKIVRKGYQKKRNFALISEMYRSLKFSKRGSKKAFF